MNRKFGTRLRHRTMRWEELERRNMMSATGMGTAVAVMPTEVESPTVITTSAVVEPAVVVQMSEEPTALGINDPLVNSPIPGIPPGDAGGVGGGNGPGRLPLQIPGFEGTGNVYTLNLATESLPEIVWFYAYLFGNQKRVSPSTADLEQPKTDLEGQDYFGVRLFGDMFNSLSNIDLSLEDTEEQPPEEPEEQPQPEGREEIEKELQKEIERSLQEEIPREL